MQWIRVEKSCPFVIKYKETLQDVIDFEALDITPSKRKGRPTASLSYVPVEKLYTSKRPVSMLKKQDMLDLLAFIPPVYHGFFNNLKTTENPEEDIGPLAYEEPQIVENNEEFECD